MSGEVSGPCEAVAKALEFILSPEDWRRGGAQRLRMQPEVPERTSALILGRLLGHNGKTKRETQRESLQSLGQTGAEGGDKEREKTD